MNPPSSTSDPLEIYQQASSLHNAGKLEEAEVLYQQLLDQFPGNPLSLTGLGTIALQRSDLEQGISLLERSVQIEPNQFMVHSNLGLALRQLGRLDEALASIDQVIALKPDYAEAHNNRGSLLQDLKRFAEALASYDRVIALKPDYANAYNDRGAVLQGLNRLDEALASFARAIELNPSLVEAYINRGITLQSLNRLDEALANYDQAVALNPGYVEVYINRGVALQSLNRLDEALASYEKAIALKPDYAEAYNNQGTLLHHLQRSDEALASCDQAIALKPEYADTYNNRGVVLQDLKRRDEALADFDRAIAIKSDFASAYLNKAFLKLLEGNFEEGWQLFEWRWKEEQQKGVFRNFPQPLWLGMQQISGRSLLIHPEQGLGDFIQFCRYVPMVEALGARVILEVPKPLVSLVSTLKGNFEIVEQGKPLPAFDLHCPIMSLPLAFRTTVESIPSDIPYLFAGIGKQNGWQQRLGTKARPRVGLVWKSATRKLSLLGRNIPLQLLEPIFRLPAEFHMLQKEIEPEEVGFLSGFPHVHLHQDELRDFSDTAALVQEMDLVISICTSVAHLAGAMGKPVWIMLPFAADYRWMLDRSDSPWYPTATLFRQPAMGGWSSVIAAVAKQLGSDESLME